ncbi:hypothetical protein M407DRAFT_26140 [Tulasnella calospora MUT 4182]|uniref:Uncharacterized protein n=1 Tax=Tulasnella calospora MUT 4182 TaxID=1051891 RepID=A0A0C3QG74_9AGAM|nr:hypothetical protein M407DRAFT_26140 [Tulasnella calospora MUT 4182]
MRPGWTDNNGWYVAMKAGALTGHASHGNLDGGDFVVDYAGHGGRTIAHALSTLVVDQQNQLVTAAPTRKAASTDTCQECSIVFNVHSDSTAMFTTDLITGYAERQSNVLSVSSPVEFAYCYKMTPTLFVSLALKMRLFRHS